jgi:hypothetical protein
MVDRSEYKIIVNTLIPFKGYAAMNLFGLIFVRKEYFENPRLTQAIFDRTIRHESVHSKQILETGVIFFYIWYLLEYFVRLFMYGFNHSKAYRLIVFEQEAYHRQNTTSGDRKFWNFLSYYKHPYDKGK